MYRDALFAAQLRFDETSAHVRARRARLTEALWELLPAEQRVRLAMLELDSEPLRQDLPSLESANRALADYDRVLDEALALAPALETAWNTQPRTLPDSALPDSDWVPCRRERTALLLASTFERLSDQVHAEVLHLDAAAELELSPWTSERIGGRTFGRFRITAELELNGAPIRLFARPNPRDQGSAGAVTLTLATPVRRSTPRLSMYATGRWQSLRGLWSRRSLTPAERRLASRYQIDADPRARTLLLDEAAVTELLCLPRHLAASLVVEDRAATLRLELVADGVLPDDVIAGSARVLAAIRNADTIIRLRGRPPASSPADG